MLIFDKEGKPRLPPLYPGRDYNAACVLLWKWRRPRMPATVIVRYVNVPLRFARRVLRERLRTVRG